MQRRLFVKRVTSSYYNYMTASTTQLQKPIYYILSNPRFVFLDNKNATLKVN